MFPLKAADRFGTVPTLAPCVAFVTAGLSWRTPRPARFAGLILPRRGAMNPTMHAHHPIIPDISDV